MMPPRRRSHRLPHALDVCRHRLPRERPDGGQWMVALGDERVQVGKDLDGPQSRHVADEVEPV
jgi:hypothetical protein